MNVSEFICEICELEQPPERDTDLIENGILDSLAIIEMIAALEDEGVMIHLTRIDRNRLRTVESIEALIAETKQNM